MTLLWSVCQQRGLVVLLKELSPRVRSCQVLFLILTRVILISGQALLMYKIYQPVLRSLTRVQSEGCYLEKV